MMNDGAIRSTFQCSETQPPLRQRRRKKCFTAMPKGHPDKDDADTECATQKITTDRQQYISLGDHLSLRHESIFKTSLS